MGRGGRTRREATERERVTDWRTLGPVLKADVNVTLKVCVSCFGVTHLMKTPSAAPPGELSLRGPGSWLCASAP